MSFEFHSCGGAALVRATWRCAGCGHRLSVDGIAPVASRRLPPWTWHREIVDRYRARHLR